MVRRIPCLFSAEYAEKKGLMSLHLFYYHEFPWNMDVLSHLSLIHDSIMIFVWGREMTFSGFSGGAGRNCAAQAR